MIVICNYIPTSLYWMFNGSEIYNKTSITIGKNYSKYNKNAIDSKNIVDILVKAYDEHIFNNLPINFKMIEELNIPISDANKIEHINRVKRALLLKDNYVISYPIVDGSKTDVLLNGYKIQDKVPQKKSKDSYCFKSVTTYKLDDNNFYWLYFTDCYKDKFIILPDKYLYDNNYFKNGILKPYISFSMNKKHIFHEFMFDFNIFDFDKFKKILDII